MGLYELQLRCHRYLRLVAYLTSSAHSAGSKTEKGDQRVIQGGWVSRG